MQGKLYKQTRMVGIDSIFFTEELVHALKVKVAAVSKVHKYTFKADLLAFTMTSYFIYEFMVTTQRTS